MLTRAGAWLWRMARQPWTLLGLLAGCAACLALSLAGLLTPPGLAGVGWLNRLAAGWLGLTLVVSLVRALDAASVALASSGRHAADARLLADPPLPIAPEAWLARAVRQVGLCGASVKAEQATALFAARPAWQRWLRAALYAGLGLWAGWALVTLLWGAPQPSAVLLLGQPTPLGQTDLTLTLEEVAVLPGPDQMLQPQAGQVRVSRAVRALDRRVRLKPGRGAVVAGRYLRLEQSLAAASVRLTQANGQPLAAYPIDGARPVGDTARVWFTPWQQEQLVAAPQAGLLVRVVRYADLAGQQGGLSAEVLDGDSGAVLADATLAATATLVARGVTIQVTPEVALQVTAQPLAARLLWHLAGALLSLGVVAHLLWPERWAWLALTEAGDIWLLDARALPWDRRWLARFEALLAPPREA